MLSDYIQELIKVLYIQELKHNRRNPFFILKLSYFKFVIFIKTRLINVFLKHYKSKVGQKLPIQRPLLSRQSSNYNTGLKTHLKYSSVVTPIRVLLY